jgi:hypothetical protein
MAITYITGTNQYGPYTIAVNSGPPVPNIPTGLNVGQTVPAPPACEAEFDALATEFYWFAGKEPTPQRF